MYQKPGLAVVVGEHEWYELYIFGHEIEDHDFCDAFVREIIQGIVKPPKDGKGWLPNVEVATLVCQRTKKGCVLRGLPVDCMLEIAPAYWFDEVVGGKGAGYQGSAHELCRSQEGR